MDKHDRLSWKLQNDVANKELKCEELRIGRMASFSLRQDPKHLCFQLSTYKFCSKMLAGKDRVLEIGCGDGFGIPIVSNEVKHLHCIDWQESFLKENRERLGFLDNVTFECCDISATQPEGIYDAAYHFDVIEHLEPEYESAFMKNTVNVLKNNGILIIGTPNETAAPYASEWNNHQHINLKNAESLKLLLEKYFENVFIFCRNDEVIHTGYYPMAHYLIGMGVGKIRSD